jgi:transketolase
LRQSEPGTIRVALTNFDRTLTRLLDPPPLEQAAYRDLLGFYEHQGLPPALLADGEVDPYSVWTRAYDWMRGNVDLDRAEDLNRRAASRLTVHELAAAASARLFEGVDPTLRWLRAEGLRIFIVSNNSMAAVGRTLRTNGVAHLVEHVFGREDRFEMEDLKPSAALIDAALRHANSVAQQAVLVGDSPTDMMAGRKAGVLTIGVCTSTARRAELLEAGADHCISSFAELQNLRFAWRPVAVDPNLAMDDLGRWRKLGRQLRVDVIRATAAAGSGHPTSSMSAADLMAVLLAKYLRYDFDTPRDPGNDHLVFSKGHAAPLLYAMFKASGILSDAELLTLRRLESRLEGHPTRALPWVDVATGSLGQGLPIGVGIALAAKRLDRLPARVWVLCGDGEMAEGSMWEAAQYAAFMGLANLVAIIDVNRLGQHGETMLGADLGAYARRLEAFGWRTIELEDGHDVGAIDRAYACATHPDTRPTAVIARTVKGSGVAAVADRPGFHGKALPDVAQAIRELGGPCHQPVPVAKPAPGRPRRFEVGQVELPRYALGSLVPVRRGYGEALVALGRGRGDIVALDADVGSSTYTRLFAEAFPERYFEMHIAEQQMIATAVGLQVRGWTVFASTFAAFLCRAHDFLRMAAVSEADLKLVGSHAGVSIGEDGSSQMALEDLAMLRAVHGSVVLYPSDANQASKLVAVMAGHRGISYLRTTRTATPVIYGADEEFEVGGSRVVRRSDRDDVAVVGAGITVHEALRAAVLLEHEGIRARVIDCYSVKPIDRTTLHAAARAAGGRLVTVEDHRPEGGLGDAVLDAFADVWEHPRIIKLAVASMPRSGTPEQLRSRAGIDAEHIVAAARRLVHDC